MSSYFGFAFESLVQMNSNHPACSCISPTHSFCHVIFIHHIVALHWLCFLSVAGNCPLSVDVASTMWSMTTMENYIIFREQERESGILSEWIRGFCLPGTFEDSIESSSVSTITSSKQRLLRGDNYRQQRENTINAMQQYDAWTWHVNMLWFELMQLATRLNEVGLNQRFKFKLHMWLFNCHSFDLS